MKATNQRNSLALIVTTIAVSALLASTVGCSTKRSVGAQTDDAATTAAVKSRLVANPQVSSYEIDVDSTDGAVRLSGWVETEAERAAAERVARQTEGVRSVRNEIKLGDPSLSENVNDGVVLMKVKSKLAADPDVSALDIDVDVSRGVVTLTGDVGSSAQANEAIRIARETDGVKSVVSRLEVRTSKQHNYN
jgi:osmotically-inducible protein OsmY